MTCLNVNVHIIDVRTICRYDVDVVESLVRTRPYTAKRHSVNTKMNGSFTKINSVKSKTKRKQRIKQGRSEKDIMTEAMSMK